LRKLRFGGGNLLRQKTAHCGKLLKSDRPHPVETIWKKVEPVFR
jgi:hypothetical protein